MGINMDGDRDVLGLWVGPPGGEGAKWWMTLLTELRNRGVGDCFIVCCDRRAFPTPGGSTRTPRSASAGPRVPRPLEERCLQLLAGAPTGR
jgi:hypothetical protein